MLPHLDGSTSDYYKSHPEARKKRVAQQAAINRRPEERKRRSELNQERRRRGVYGKGGPDMSHTTSGRMVPEDASTNRARNGHGKQERYKSDSQVQFYQPMQIHQ